METRVKERLVGAVILVALIVLLVPELLSGPKRAADSAAPDAGNGSVRTYTIEIGAPQGGASTAVVPAAAPALQTPMANTLPVEAQPGQPPAGTSQAAAEPTPAPALSIPVATPDSSTPVTASPARTKSGETPPAKPVPRPAQPEPSAEGWAVQLGSFSSRENAERLVTELKARGYKAFVSRFESDGRVRHRVRVGPEQDRARADSLAQRLRREGRQVSVVEQP